MSERWWRAKNSSVNNRKLQQLPGELFKSWYNINCLASANDGVLPCIADLAYALRISEQRAAAIITQLITAKLLDKVGDDIVPHDWDEHQFISDVTDPTAPKRMKRYRDKKRNERNATVTDRNAVTAVIRPDTETEQTTEPDTETEAIASGANAPRDVRADLFGRGLQTLARLTGKGPDACRSFVGKCLKAASDDAVTVLGLIEDAERNRVVDPSAWISARLKATGPPPGKPLTEHQRAQHETKDILNELGNFARGGSGSGSANIGLLLDHSGQRSESLRGGIGEDVIDLPRSGYRSSG